MKTIFYSATLLGLCLFSCKENKPAETVQAQDSATVAAPEAEAQTNIIVSNEGKYPTEIKIFEDKDFSDRVKKLVGAQYDEILKNFNVESPIVSDAGIYKFTGCRQHDCPAYQTTVLYDAQNDNLNVLVDQEGKITEFAEKGKINYTDALKAK